MTDNLEDEVIMHKEYYSQKDNYCKYQGICEFYNYSCRLGEININDCPYAEKIIRADKIKQLRERRKI